MKYEAALLAIFLEKENLEMTRPYPCNKLPILHDEIDLGPLGKHLVEEIYLKEVGEYTLSELILAPSPTLTQEDFYNINNTSGTYEQWGIVPKT